MLMERGRKAAASSSSQGSEETTPHASHVSLVDEPSYSPGLHTHPGRSHIHLESGLAEVREEDEDLEGSSELRQYLENAAVPASERTPLLERGRHISDKRRGWRHRTAIDLAAARNRLSKVTPKDVLRTCVVEPVSCLPAVMLGLLLNVLDGVSYGMIL